MDEKCSFCNLQREAVSSTPTEELSSQGQSHTDKIECQAENYLNALFRKKVASLHRDNGKLGQNDGPSDGSGYLLGALNTESYVTIVVPNSDESLEPGPLACPSLLLHGHDLQNLIL
ncbi:hypothetical protein U0070_006579 [Myodes glareolus]|uniref:Uncharacterized protein n=1 Tax=Myodes glareolus TaxID=447135 RepID=A0AAW0J5M4_MYOGA